MILENKAGKDLGASYLLTVMLDELYQDLGASYLLTLMLDELYQYHSQ